MANMSDAVLDLEKEDPAVSTDQLQFQDIPHSGLDDTSLDSSRKAKGDKVRVQTHTFNAFPEAGEDSDDDGDKSDLLQSGRKQPSFWTFEYYQAFFDVETFQVLRRILGSMLPNPRSNYLQSQIRPNPDLYGPFWICTTLVFTTAIAGNLANYIQNSGENYEWRYDFHKVTFAAAAIFSYWWLVPTLLWGVLWWRGSQAGIVYSEIICVYGYSLAIYVPISVLWVIQLQWLQWMLVLVGMALSGTVLVITFWPAVKDDDKKISLITMATMVLLHGLLAMGFMLYFFKVSGIDQRETTTTGNVTLSSYTPLPTSPVSAATHALPVQAS